MTTLQFLRRSRMPQRKAVRGTKNGQTTKGSKRKTNGKTDEISKNNENSENEKWLEKQKTCPKSLKGKRSNGRNK